MALILVLLVIFLDHVGLGMVYPIFSSLLFQTDGSFVDADMSNTTRGWFLGLLLSAPAVTAFLSGPILGALSDQKGRRPMYLFSLVLACIGYGLCVIGVDTKSIVGLIIARAIVGISMGNGAVVSATIVDLSSQSNKTKNFGLYCMSSGIGFATGPFVGGWLSGFGLTVPFFAAGVAASINLLLIYLLFKETNTLKKVSTIRVWDGIRNLQRAFGMRELRMLFLVVTLFCFSWSLFYEFLPVVWISDYGFSLQKVGVFFAFGSAMFAISSGLLIRPVVDRYRPHSILFYSFCLMGCCILSILFRPPSWWIWVYLAGVNFLVALAFPTYTTIVSNSVGKDSQGEILGILESIQAAAFGLSPLLAGFLLGIHLHLPMALGGVSMVLAALVMAMIPRKTSLH